MSTVNIRESLRHIDDDTYCKYDLLTMYDSCKLSDEDKCCIAKLLADSEDPEVIYQKLSTYFDEDNVDDLVGFTNEIQETDFDRFISETQAELKTRFSNVIYDADHCNFIVSDDEGTCVEIEVRPSDSELGNFEFYLDGCYDSPCIYDTLEAAKYVVVKHICDAMALAKSVVSEIDDDALQYKIYDVTEDDGHVVAHCMIESTNSFNDIKLGKVGGAKIKKMVESLLEDPSYFIDESNKQKLCKYAVIPCDILPGVAVKEFNNSMEINGGISEMSESSDDVQFNKSDRVKEKCAGNCRVGSVIKSDNDMTLVEWDNSDSDDIEWIDNSKIEKFIESAEIHDEIDSLYVDDTSDGHWSWDYDDEELANIYGGDTKYDENPGGLDIDEYNLDESMKGFVRTYCDECGKMNRVEVEFKDFNKPFEDTIYTCSHCGAKNLLTDPHEYNDDGTIKESLSSRYIDKDGYVSISNIANYIVDTFDGDLDDRYACINSLIDSFKDEGKVSTEVIDQFAGGHNLVDKKIDESTTELVEDSEETDDLISAEQEFDSAATSINSSKLPAVYNMVKFNPGDVVVDFGGGKFDNAVNYLKDQDVTLLVYDPYNRSAEHNKDVLRVLKEHGGADAAVNSNVLNVIKEPEARNAVLQNIKKITKKGAPIYITVYEGTGKGNEGPTKSGYQLNRKTSDYMDEISQVFSNVTRKGKLITAINESLNKSLNENLSPKEGDRVRMDHYAKLNNGQEGIVTGRIGELCWVTWDDGTKSKEIKGYLTVIKRDSKVVDESVNPADLTDCPECGDTSFDSKRGRCTKCNYREELDESKSIKEDLETFNSLKQKLADGAFDNYVAYDSEYSDFIDALYNDAVAKLEKEYKDLYIEPSIQNGRGSVFASYDVDGETYRCNWNYEYECEAIEEYIAESNNEEEFVNHMYNYLKGKLEDASTGEDDYDDYDESLAKPQELDEGLMDEFYKTERYLDIEIPEICNDALVKLSDMTELQIKRLKNQCANFYGYVENILFYMKESLNDSQDKGLEPEFEDDSSLAALGSNISSPTWDITFKCPNIETEDDDMKYIKYSVKAETQEDARDFAKEFIRRQQSNENGLMWKDARVFSIYVR